jgi:hypothetical protein
MPMAAPSSLLGVIANPSSTQKRIGGHAATPHSPQYVEFEIVPELALP